MQAAGVETHVVCNFLFRLLVQADVPIFFESLFVLREPLRDALSHSARVLNFQTPENARLKQAMSLKKASNAACFSRFAETLSMHAEH